jgi:hypothetical protein
LEIDRITAISCGLEIVEVLGEPADLHLDIEGLCFGRLAKNAMVRECFQQFGSSPDRISHIFRDLFDDESINIRDDMTSKDIEE